MDDNIIEYISQFVKLTDEEISIIKKQNQFKVFKKNELLLAEGEYAKDCYFIVKGCVRAYYVIDGEERCTNFFFENQTITPLSYQTKQPSAYYLACLEDCVISQGSELRNQQLVAQVPKLSALISRLNEDLLREKTVEFDHFKNHPPEERYLNLLQNKPQYINRIPLYHLASYLGITPISLSRIRKRILNK